MNDHALNKGLWLHNPSPCPEQATIAVTGVGRSGTTMLARVLSELGLYMGEWVTPRSHEDKEFQKLVKVKDFAGIEIFCRKRNKDFSKWGFKVPALRDDLAKFASFMRNPRLIVIFRDALAVSLRSEITMGAEVAKHLVRTAKDYKKLAQHITSYEGPLLAISYEKALQFPHEIVREIGAFCNLPCDDETVDRASAVIQNGHPAYFGEVCLNVRPVTSMREHQWFSAGPGNS